MAENNPELQAKLQELEHELEEGDITHKGSVDAVSSWPSIAIAIAIAIAAVNSKRAR
jgi:hypothetical protein